MRRSAAFMGVTLLAAACTGVAPPEREARPRAATAAAPECAEVQEHVKRARRGHVADRSPDLSLLPAEPHYIGPADQPVHTGPWDYLADVPLVFYGPGLVADRGGVQDEATLADVAPTLAELSGFSDFEAPDGKPLRKVATSGGPPRLIVVIVWDGAGWNLLRHHRDSWHFLREAMETGISYEAATIGSTPSNTPPIHTTLGTGAFPRNHGIPHVKMRTEDGDYVDPFEGNVASAISVPTFADTYDAAMGNRPRIGVVGTVNWHLGMIGKGGERPGGDRDVAVLLNDAGLTYGNSSIYEIPDVARPDELLEAAAELDAEDGERDLRWRGESLEDSGIRNASPAFVAYQQRVLERTLSTMGFGEGAATDLMFVNFKGIDDAGHRWGMTSPHVGETLQATDSALERLTAFLDRSIGKSSWIVVVTADHGQTPYPEESGGWPIRGGEITAGFEREFEGLEVLRTTAAGIYLKDPSKLEGDVGDEIAEWFVGYTVADNVPEGRDLPPSWRDRGETPLFSAVLVGDRLAATRCTG